MYVLSSFFFFASCFTYGVSFNLLNAHCFADYNLWLKEMQ